MGKVGSSCSARPQLWCRTSPEPMTSSINYTAFSDDTHYVFSIVCYFDTKKAKVKFDKEKNAIHVMGPAPGKGMEKVNGYVLLPKNCVGSEENMEIDNKKGLKVRFPKAVPTAYTIPPHIQVGGRRCGVSCALAHIY